MSSLLIAAGAPARAAESELLWSVPVAADPSGQGFWVPDATTLADGRIALVGLTGQRVSVMVEDETGMIGEWADLPLEGMLLNVTADPAAGLWLTGYTRSGSGDQGIFRDAAIIRLNKNGVIAWGRVFGDENEYWAIEDAAVLPSGDLVVSGNYARRESFVARVSVAGEWLWDKRFGVGKGTRIGVNDNGDIIVAGFSDNNDDPNRVRYSESGTLWTFSEDGDLRGETVFRADLNGAPESFFGRLAMAVDAHETFVATGWNGPDIAPVAVTRLTPEGEAIGELVLARESGNAMGGPSCVPSLAATPTLLWLGCATEGEVRLYRVQRTDGQYSILEAPIPECHRSGSAELVLQPEGDNVLVLGRRAGYSTSGGCAWLMRVTP
jgi:hypothetical protein